MKIEKISENQIKIFVSSRDLQDREISISDLWSNGPKVKKLFGEMMELANLQVGFDLEGKPMLVEAYGMPPEGFFIIITKGENGLSINEYFSDKWFNEFNHIDELNDLDEEDLTEDEMDVLVGDPNYIIFSFDNFDEAILAGKRIANYVKDDVSLYKWENGYCIVIDCEKLIDEDIDIIESILSEFGDEQLFTKDFLLEHGKLVLDGNFITVVEEFLS